MPLEAKATLFKNMPHLRIPNIRFGDDSHSPRVQELQTYESKQQRERITLPEIVRRADEQMHPLIFRSRLVILTDQVGRRPIRFEIAHRLPIQQTDAQRLMRVGQEALQVVAVRIQRNLELPKGNDMRLLMPGVQPQQIVLHRDRTKGNRSTDRSILDSS